MVRSAGKTGTAQAYRDAWYVGYTGNYVAAVWLGNDDYRPTNNMTGGTLPAMVWQRFMAYAHQNLDLKPIPGIENPLPPDGQAVASADVQGAEDIGLRRPAQAMPLATRNLLNRMTELFRAAPALKPAPGSEALSAL
jgi:penicillin-binding protein 1A